MPRSPTGGNGHNGSKWITKARRARIYARDGWRCVWCRDRVINGDGPRPNGVRRATLDHIVPRKQGGTNVTHNLITACDRCNSERGELTVFAFAQRLARGSWCCDIADTLARVIDAIERPLS